jgi:hypothetical protein
MEQKIAPGERKTADKRNVLAATVSRYLRRAKASIEASGSGAFP